MHPLVLLAKDAVENYIKEGKIISVPEDFPNDFLKRRAGVFVTITKKSDFNQKERLRGCIGTYLPLRKNIAQEVIQNAISAATQDLRFGPVQKEELPYLSYTVYILSEPKLVNDISELNPQKYGIIVKTFPLSFNDDVVFNGHFVAKTGVLLPDLEGVDTIEKQILIALEKAGIDPSREKFLIYKFMVEKFK
ncbi:MAG: TIGR00296 family protein [Candidatus Aenigmatarchaeota archaeon]